MTPQRLEEERRLMYVGITRARTTLAVSTLRRRKKGRETVAGVPSRFIAEMKLDEKTTRAKIRARSSRRCGRSLLRGRRRRSWRRRSKGWTRSGQAGAAHAGR